MFAKAKSDEGVLFQADADAAEFNLKLAGLNQYTVTGKITDPALMVTDDDYRLAKSRVPEHQQPFRMTLCHVVSWFIGCKLQ